MNIAIITDSTCDLGPAGEIAYRIDIVPLTVAFGDNTYRDGIDMSGDEFYTRLSKVGVLPVTSQPSPALFEEVFRRRLDEDKVILGILLSGAFSGTYQSAVLARSSFSEAEQQRILLVDSRHATGNLALLVLEACRMRDQGCGAEEIRDHIVSLIPRVRLYAIFESLKYLRMGGRLSAAAAAVGGILNIVPVISIEDGKAEVVARIRKSRTAFRRWLREKINSDLPDLLYPVVYLHSSNPALVAPLQDEFRYLLAPERTYCLSLGSVIGTHAGPGAYGMVYVTRSD